MSCEYILIIFIKTNNCINFMKKLINVNIINVLTSLRQFSKNIETNRNQIIKN